MLHPDEDTLLGLVSGEADLPLRVILEGHLASCPSCRAAAGELAAAGGAMLDAASVPAAELPARLWEQVSSAIAEVRAGTAGATAGGILPAGRAYDDRARRRDLPPRPRPLGSRGDLPPLPLAARLELPPTVALRWHWGLARGAWYAEVARDPGTRSALLLAGIRAGGTFPEHLHLGPEDVLVLSGGYGDAMGSYEAGDYTCYPPATRHQPRAEPDEGCWSLIRLERVNLFTGWRGRLQRLLR